VTIARRSELAHHLPAVDRCVGGAADVLGRIEIRLTDHQADDVAPLAQLGQTVGPRAAGGALVAAHALGDSDRAQVLGSWRPLTVQP
jgi:hypothetical protein